MPGSVIVGGARTPMGKLLGGLRDFSGTDLGAVAIRAALERAGITGDQVDYVVLGQVLQAGAGQMPARQAAVKAGVPMSVPSLLVNKVCLSGLDAIALADQLIGAGEFEVVVAGGMESMTNAPHVLPALRKGHKYGAVEMIDSMAYDGLIDAFDHIPMGESTDRYSERLGITRAEQDEFAARSHQRAAAAQKNGLFDEEIVPVQVAQRRGDPIEIREDEGIRGDTTAEVLAKLKPAFGAEGTITAGSSSPISDGACAVRGHVTGRGRAARGHGAGRDRRVRHGRRSGQLAALPAVERDPEGARSRPGSTCPRSTWSRSTRRSPRSASSPMRDLGIGPEMVNVNGGAIALGHPIGMSGARLALHLALELRRRGGGLGAAALCGGGGQGDALLLKV